MNKFYLKLALISVMLLSFSVNGLADYLSKANVDRNFEVYSVLGEKWYESEASTSKIFLVLPVQVEGDVVVAFAIGQGEVNKLVKYRSVTKAALAALAGFGYNHCCLTTREDVFGNDDFYPFDSCFVRK
jgi:hypothetical protein